MPLRLSSMLLLAALLLAALPLAAQTPAQKQDETLRLNQIQVIGTHNSYHAGFAPSEAKFMQQHNPKAFEGLDYRHQPLDSQLNAGIGQLEIDVYADSKGGRFSHPAITEMVAKAGLPPDPPLDPSHDFDKPGFKVMHVVGIDQRSSCKTLVACLTIIRTWSNAHPQHLPLFLLIETKYDKPGDKPQPWSVPLESFTPAVFDALDAEIRSVFPPSEIITPDQVRGSAATLPEALARTGWPTLAASRGKVLFLMDQSSMTSVYTQGHPALKGRILFTNATPSTPDAAFVEQNTGSPTAIDDLVRHGYLVRTRADEPTADARNNNTTKRDRALSTGAQMISTDYPASEPAPFPGHYHVEFPGNLTARCNPVLAPTSCQSNLLEPPSIPSRP